MSNNDHWAGRERRSGEDRREHGDRRDEIRFEPDKKDRRKGRGRRTVDRDLWEEAVRKSSEGAE